ncbi:spatacsin [Selaginella moellendorffii]|uniref:spatacsin n=1 Tax=Selaginella moellendorffii TaxID=88036 RepID=UPI000D1D1228|nr:spatacsin [Selaginella moellendorffii]|eukprot:XP_024514946.1 spatacsin [Selaginella moellendorffii]
MEDEDDDPIAVMQLHSWPEIPLGEIQQLTDAALSPSLRRLLLVSRTSGSARLLTLKKNLSVSLPQPMGSFAWGCQTDCYTSNGGSSGPFEELLFTCSDRGLMIYGFASKVSEHGLDSSSSSSIYEVELGYHDVDKPKLVFLEAEAWPDFVPLSIARDSPSFLKLVEFAIRDSGTDQASLDGRSYGLVSLVSSFSGSLVAMILQEASSGDRAVVIARISEWDVRWIARILLDGQGQDWVDFSLVLDRFLGLTGSGKIFIWEASTGKFLSVVHVSGTTATFSRLYPAKPRGLVGVADELGQIFFVSLESHFSQPGIGSWRSSWELADSEVWIREAGTKPTLSPSGFTPKHFLAAGKSSGYKGRKLRKVVLPCVSSSSSSDAAIAISSCSITRLVRRDGSATVVQSPLYCSTGTDAATKTWTYSNETVGFSFQGSLYLVSANSLTVVLPPVIDSSHQAPRQQWWCTSTRELPSFLSCQTPVPQLQQWQMAVLDRCLIYDGLDEAEHLFVENGWNIRLARLRKLQLALDYQRTNEIAPLLNKLIPVGGAETGVLRLMFTAVELMLNQFGSDNELSQAARLLALGARFTRELIKVYGLRSFPDDNLQTSQPLLELSQFLETIRTLQDHLHSRKTRPNTEKDEAVPEVERRVQATPSVEPHYNDDRLVSTVIASPEDEENSRRHPSQETPKEMIARWDSENIDVLGIVKDALRAGRIPLAVVQLHHRRCGETGKRQLEADVFKEVRDIGRSIVYELLCKGKTPIALAALRRLGEDIPTVLHDLAFGTVRRSLRAHTTKELRRHGHLDPKEYRLLQTISRIESVYPSNNFWKSYRIRHEDSVGTSMPSDRKLQIWCTSPVGDCSIDCGEIDGVVLGSWNRIIAKDVEDEVNKEERSAAYWAGALVWLQSLDELTIDRMILEQSQASNVAWDSQLKYAVVHHSWSASTSLISDIPSSELQESELEIQVPTSRNGIVVVTIPKVKRLAPNLDACSNWLRYLVERDLARGHIFLRSLWTGATELLSLLSRAGLIFSHSASDVQQVDTVKAIQQLVVRSCVQYRLPWLLELYLDQHLSGFDEDAETFLEIAEDCHWARWLLLSRDNKYEYEASFANAMAIFAGQSILTLDDMATFGSELMALSTLAYAPVLPQKCLYSGVKKQSGNSWQCSLEQLQAGLKPFPTLWNTLKFWCLGKKVKVDPDLPNYLQWRLSLFSSADYGTSLLTLLPRWLPKSFKRVLYLSIQGGGVGESFMSPASWEESIKKRIDKQIHLNSLETPESKLELQLLQGCPLAAFSYLMSLRANEGRSGDDGVLSHVEEDLLCLVKPLGVRNFRNDVVTAACSLLLELCGVSATALRTDIAALRRIAESESSGEDVSNYLAESLSNSYTETGVAGEADKRCTSLILEHLERASMTGEDANGLWLKTGEGNGQELRTSQMSMSERWSLVTAFCRVHHLALSTVYLTHLAGDDDWVGFLAEAQSEGCPLDILVGVASKNFTDEQLRSHVLTVLNSMSGKSDHTEILDHNELFSLIAEIESRKTPGADLIQKAKSMRWPLLAVVASCFNDVSPLTCVAAWLEVTAERETNGVGAALASNVGYAVDATNAVYHTHHRLPVYTRINAKRRRLLSSQNEDDFIESCQPMQPTQILQAGDGTQESLAKMVATLCEKQLFIPLLKAFELFLPSSPLLHFIRFLRAFSQMRLSEASAHLADFSAFLKEEIHSRGGRSGTTWISKAAIAGANAILAACPSAYEKRCMLQLLAAADFGDGGVAAMGYRKLYWKIQLADPSLRQGRQSGTQVDDLDDDALLKDLEASGQWEDARSWARQLDLSNQGNSGAVHHVTEMQAEAMVAEWKELLWDVPEQRAALWRHCQALFTKHSYPPLKAGMFFLKHAEDIEQHGLPAELHAVLLLALQWLSGSITGSAPVYPVPLLRELETRVWLLAVESEVLMKSSSSNSPTFRLGALNLESPFSMHSGSPVDRTAAKIATVDGHLKVFNSMHADIMDDIRQVHSPVGSGGKDGGSKPKRRLLRRGQEKEQTSPDMDNKLKITDEDSTAGWEDKVGEGEVERAILALVEVGQVQAARQLQQKLSPSRVPAELVWAETAYNVAMLSSPTVKGSIRGSALGAPVMKTLNKLKLKDVSSASPLQAMEALTAACREGCGRGHCRRVTAVAQIANFLDLPFFEAFQKHPTELLQLLSLKGQDAVSEAKLLVATHSINASSIARILAESFLKGLLAAHRGGYMDSSSSKEEGPAPLLWRSSDFVQWGQLCPSEPELGHALMRLVISGHDMPHACEVELLILAHQFYESSACLDGMDVLVALAATRVEAYVAEGDFSALARLVTGVSNFQALRFVLDLLIENGQLELLLKKRAAVDALKESSASVRGFRMAVISALKHFNPHDLDAFGMVFSHFSMAHEMANLLESRGRKGLTRSIRNDPEQNEEVLEIMRFFVEASEVYAGIDCGNKTRWCCAQASLLSLQLRMPEIMWLNLTETNARRLLVDQRRFQEALIVAEAYGLNQPAEWVPVLWNQVLSPGWIEHFLTEFVASLPLRPSTLMELARIYRSEVLARGDHLDFSKWLTSGMPHEITKSFRSILKHVGDFRLRTQLTTLASGFPDVLDMCARILDKVPDIAGPLVLKRGHGGTYVSLM